MGFGMMEFGVFGLFALLLFAITVIAVVWVYRDAVRRGAPNGLAVLIAAIAFFTAPIGFLLYGVLAMTGTLDGVFAGSVTSTGGGGVLGGSGSADPPSPTTSQLPPAGWYANPEGEGQRWWDGERWTEHHQA